MSIELLNNCIFTYDNYYLNYYEYNSDGLYMKNRGTAFRLYTPFIELPEASIYQYEFIVSIEANNQCYIQVERFNENKTSISNNAAITTTIKGTVTDTDRLYIVSKGTLSLSTFGTGDNIQNTKYIKVRVINNYNDSSGYFKVHSWSLKAINNDLSQEQILKNGQLITESFREINIPQVSIYKSGFINSNNFYEY